MHLFNGVSLKKHIKYQDLHCFPANFHAKSKVLRLTNRSLNNQRPVELWGHPPDQLIVWRGEGHLDLILTAGRCCHVVPYEKFSILQLIMPLVCQSADLLAFRQASESICFPNISISSERCSFYYILPNMIFCQNMAYSSLYCALLFMDWIPRG